ncbi:MAG: hypothetical protein A2Y24_04195 [Clostridiales bacterium GWE2_32_10]|nr:MAG: hypothetical protein A2Y24_04195 [Clostridiales bacterium GWE2_32_10]
MNQCTCCNQKYEEELYISDKGNTFCDDCLGECNAICKICEETFEKPDMYEDEDGKYICEKCYAKLQEGGNSVLE